MGPAFFAPRRLYAAATCLLLLAVFTLNVVRVENRSITHDEAFTYRYFVATPWYYLFDHFDANNHLVNSLGCRVTTGLFGLSETTLRLPGLAGGALYLIAVFLVCRCVFGSGWFLPVAVGMLVLNPLILDYLSLARGYSLALGFFLAGMYQFIRYLDDFSIAADNAAGRKRLTIAAVCVALAVHSNLTFIIAGSCLAIVFWAIVVQNGRVSLDSADYAKLLHSLRYDFVRPGLWVFGILATTWFKLRPSAFYVGEESLSASLRGMTDTSLAHHHMTWPCDTASPMFQSCLGIVATWGVGLVLLATAFAWSKVALRWMNRRGNFGALDGAERFLLLSGGTLLLSCAVVFGTHFAFGMKYPHERTGLYLVATFCLAGLATLHELLRSRGMALWLLKIPCLAMVLLSLTQFAAELPATYYHEWCYDCTSREVFQAIADRVGPSPSAPVRVVSHWWHLPSLYFYRTIQHADWMELVDSRGGEQPCDFGVGLQPTSVAGAALTPIFAGKESYVVVTVADAYNRRSMAATSPPSSMVSARASSTRPATIRP